MDNEAFVALVRETKLTTADAAERLGVSQPTIRRWRNGVNLPAYAVRYHIIAALEAARDA